MNRGPFLKLAFTIAFGGGFAMGYFALPELGVLFTAVVVLWILFLEFVNRKL